jgi:hypothetical protein
MVPVLQEVVDGLEKKACRKGGGILSERWKQ